MSFENSGSITAAVSGGFLGAGLVYLQYQQIASFDWNRIEGLFSSTHRNFTNQISNSQYATFVMPDLGIPLTSSISIGFTTSFMKG
jgi:glycerol uptake facilitator-like aquaporin